MAQATDKIDAAKSQVPHLEEENTNADTKYVEHGGNEYETSKSSDIPAKTKNEEQMENDLSKTDLGVAKPSEVEQLRQQLSVKDFEIAKLKMEKVILNRNLTKASQKNNDKISDLEKLKKDNKTKIQLMSSQLQEHDDKYKESTEEVKKLKNAMEQDKKQLACYYKELIDLRSQNANFEPRITLYVLEVKELNSRITQLLCNPQNSSTTDMAAENERTEQKNKFCELVRTLQDGVERCDRRIEDLEEVLRSKKDDPAANSAKVNESTEVNMELESSMQVEQVFSEKLVKERKNLTEMLDKEGISQQIGGRDIPDGDIADERIIARRMRHTPTGAFGLPDAASFSEKSLLVPVQEGAGFLEPPNNARQDVGVPKNDSDLVRQDSSKKNIKEQEIPDSSSQRTEVSNTAECLEDTCLVKAGESNATGFRIGARSAITVAHALQDDNDREDTHSDLSSATFVFENDGKTTTFGPRMAIAHHLKPGDEPDQNNMDIAMVILGTGNEDRTVNGDSDSEKSINEANLVPFANIENQEVFVGDRVTIIYNKYDENVKDYRKKVEICTVKDVKPVNDDNCIPTIVLEPAILSAAVSGSPVFKNHKLVGLVYAGDDKENDALMTDGGIQKFGEKCQQIIAVVNKIFDLKRKIKKEEQKLKQMQTDGKLTIYHEKEKMITE